MAVNNLLVKSYAQNVYRTGSNSLANIATVRPEYVVPVMQYSADTYYIDDINIALTRGWITSQEHFDTLALKDLNDPQYRPVIEMMAVAEEST